MEVPDEAWPAVVRLAGEEREIAWPARWDLAPGTVVARADLHRIFGGGKSTGIAASDDTPNILFFKDVVRGASADEGGHEWSDDGAFLVRGMEENGETLTFHNESVVKHVRRGKPLRVFQNSPRGACTYLGEFAIDQANPVERWIDTGRERVIKPRLMPSLPYTRYQRMAPVFRLFPLDALSSLPSVAPSRKRIPQQRLLISVSLVPGPTSTDAVPPNRDDSRSSGREEDSTADVRASIANLLALLRDHDNAADTVAQLDAAAVLSDVLERRLRWGGLTELRRLIDDPNTREAALHRVLQRHTWMFGGQYVGSATRRALSLRDQIDIPLIRSDGTLHGVELKTASVDELVKVHRSHLIVGPKVNEAVGQAMNYLRGLDEQRDAILNNFRVDCRRTTMTVVIGHPRYVKGEITAADVAETIRTYNSHLARIQVMTYKDLLDGAERSLHLSGDATTKP
ncbi:hypothetical protein GCM10009687_56340 [Asanoa iriomotensis]